MNRCDINELLLKVKLSGLSECQILNILEAQEDAVYVIGRNSELLYMNKASEALFGFTLKQMIGKTNEQINSNYERWYPSIVPDVYREKQRYMQEQTSMYNGKKFITTLIPILDKRGQIEMVVSFSKVKSYKINTLKDEDFQKKDPHKIITEGEILYESEEMAKVINSSKKVAKLDATVLLTGETGTGKNMIAKFIHDNSNRAKKPFVMVNCAAIPETIIESELFGYEPYSFSGSDPKGREGLIAVAEGGTIFLDEIGELSQSLQPKLLGFLQSQTYMKVGGRKEIKSDVRIISASNKDLAQESLKGRFRSDLYYRLNVIEIDVPTLRERKDDIKKLAHMFFYHNCQKYNLKKKLSDNAINVLENYDWPGNVRQLKNYIEKLVIVSESELITEKDIVLEDNAIGTYAGENVSLYSNGLEVKNENIVENKPICLENELMKLEKNLVIETYKNYKTCRGLAKQLGISTTKAHKLINRYCDDKNDV